MAESPSNFSPLDFGAAGNGLADDTAAVQQAFDSGAGGVPVVLPAGKVFLCSDHLYLYGATRFSGPGTLLLDVNPQHGAYWINAGITGYGATLANGKTSTWTGTMEGVTLRTTAQVTDPGLRLFNVHRCENARVQGCTFDVRPSGLLDVGGFGTNNNAAFCNDAYRKGLRVTDNRFLAAQGQHGSEGVGVSHASDVWVTGNLIDGFGDDPIGLHAVEDFHVTDNHCRSVDGRLYLSNSRRGVVRGNHLERIAAPDGTFFGGGGLLWAEVEYTGYPAPSDLTIDGNELYLPAGLSGPTYTIRLRGVRRLIYHGNRCHDASGQGIPPECQPQRLVGWSDPEGLEDDDVARVREVHACGNLLTGELRKVERPFFNAGDGNVGLPFESVVLDSGGN